MKDPDKIWDEANKLKQDRYNWKMGKDFQECNKDDFTKRMETKYNYIFTSSRTMFKNLIEDDKFDMGKLRYMINLMRSMKEKTKSFETASEEVGKRFADEYIQPLVDKLDREKAEKEEKKIEELE